METREVKPHLVLLSSPGLGHLIPVLELGKRLTTRCNFDVTIFVVTTDKSPAEAQLLHSVTTPQLCQIIELPPVDISGLVHSSATVVTRICVIMREIRPVFRSALSSLKFRPAAVIFDLFGTESFAAAEELGIPKYVYIGSNALFLALTVYVPTLDKEVDGEYVDEKEALRIPGCIPVRPVDVVDPMLDRTNQQYSEYVRVGVEIPTADGILINTWEALEPTTLATFRDEKLLGPTVKARVFPIGPLRRSVGPVGSRSELLDWLDQQPKSSVVYVSFGSGGTLSFEQMQELALGIELSKQRFIWVIRAPTINSGDGSFFSAAKGGDDISGYLPDGFLARTKDVGVLVPQWAPQIEIISHPSVGLFLSHCGWNSTMESITNGVPMIAWPLYAEQRLNAALLGEELGVAIRPKVLPSKGVVKREEIGSMIRRIMVEEEGTKIRNRVEQLKSSAETALGEGGSSYNSLFLWTEEWKKKVEMQ